MEIPRLYVEFAEWWPLLSRVEDYVEEAASYSAAISEHCQRPLETLVEFGSGGGNNAWHMKAQWQLTLVDIAEGMLAHSRTINPECEHHCGDMRDVRLGKTFDAVFIHDAIDYMTSLVDLRRAMTTAFTHCRPGGVALFAPDHTRETFASSTDHGGYDGPDRGLRYLEWLHDPDPSDNLCTTDYAYMLRLPDGSARVEHDRHIHGLFKQQEWLDTITSVGFEARMIPFDHSELPEGAFHLFVGQRPAE